MLVALISTLLTELIKKHLRRTHKSELCLRKTQRSRFLGEKSPCGHRTSRLGPKHKILCVRIRKILSSLFLGGKKPLRAPHQQHRVPKRYSWEEKNPCGHRTSIPGPKHQILCVHISFRNVIKSVLGTKWVAVARNGLILWENGAMGLNIILK